VLPTIVATIVHGRQYRTLLLSPAGRDQALGLDRWRRVGRCRGAAMQSQYCGISCRRTDRLASGRACRAASSQLFQVATVPIVYEKCNEIQ